MSEYVFTMEQLKVLYLPKFRQIFEEKIIQPNFDHINLINIQKQYSKYVNSMNLLSYDKIKQNFNYFS